MVYAKKVEFDSVREVAFGSITSSYAAVGAVLSVNPRIIRISNQTDAQAYISFDGVHNHIRLAANSFVLYDFSANKVNDEGFFLKSGDFIYTKYVSAPSQGSLWIEIVYGYGGI